MKLSIITINFNNIDGLKKTIDSVICQSFKDFEWIIIDGGSSDGSKEVIEQYADHFAYWVSEPDKGIYNAMNKGITVAKGEYLQFLNSGDWLCDNTVLERCFSKGFTSDILYGGVYLYNNKNIETLTYPKSLTLKFFFESTLCHNSTFIKRELFRGNLYEEEYRFISDWLFFLHAALNECSFKGLDDIILYYDMSGVSSTSGDIVVKEREAAIRNLIPDMLLEDFKKMDEMEGMLNRTQVKKVLEYGEKKKLYHKMITFCLLIIEKIDSFTNK